LNEEVIVLLRRWEAAKCILDRGKKLNEKFEIIGLRSKK
jgi:hypothetical protein